MTKTLRSLSLLAGLAIMSFAVSGCTVNIGAGDNTPMGNNGMMGDGSAEFSTMDIMFAQMMIPHHQQAVDMGNLAETRASNAEVMELALQIRDEQAPEIEQMKGWLPPGGGSEHMGHDMGMDGMLSGEEFAALEAASGAEFDRLFVAGMIAHHEGAIQMTQMISDSANAEVRTLAEAIVTSQTAQIVTLKELLANLP
jgi:uncharacterized protein (DUF305 family)